MRTHYDILGIAPTSTPSEVRRAYRRAAMRWHPDRHANHVDEATDRFNEIGHAYRVLSSTTRRAQYDDALHGQRGSHESGPGARDPRGRVMPDDSTPSILVACAWRALHASDRVVDAMLLGLRRSTNLIRRNGRRGGRISKRRVASIGFVVAIAGLVASLPTQRQTFERRASPAVDEEPPESGSEGVRRRDVVADVFPGYDPVTRTAPFTMKTLPPSPVYDELRPLEGHAMLARFVLREDLGAAYRMYYFGIAPRSADDDCAACTAYFARFMTRRHARGETVVVPMQLVFMPERTPKATAP